MIENINEEKTEIVAQSFSSAAHIFAAVVEDHLQAMVERQAEMAARDFDHVLAVFDRD